MGLSNWALGGFLVFRVVELHSTSEFKVVTSVGTTRTHITSHTHVCALFFLNFPQIVSAFRVFFYLLRCRIHCRQQFFSPEKIGEKAQRKVNSSQLVGDITHMTNLLDSIAVIVNDKCDKWGECSLYAHIVKKASENKLRRMNRSQSC